MRLHLRCDLLLHQLLLLLGLLLGLLLSLLLGLLMSLLLGLLLLLSTARTLLAGVWLAGHLGCHLRAIGTIRWRRAAGLSGLLGSRWLARALLARHARLRLLLLRLWLSGTTLLGGLVCLLGLLLGLLRLLGLLLLMCLLLSLRMLLLLLGLGSGLCLGSGYCLRLLGLSLRLLSMLSLRLLSLRLLHGCQLGVLELKLVWVVALLELLSIDRVLLCQHCLGAWIHVLSHSTKGGQLVSLEHIRVVHAAVLLLLEHHLLALLLLLLLEDALLLLELSLKGWVVNHGHVIHLLLLLLLLCLLLLEHHRLLRSEVLHGMDARAGTWGHASSHHGHLLAARP